MIDGGAFLLLSEVYAACVIEYAKQQDDGVLKGARYSVVKAFRDSFNLPHSDELIHNSFDILEKLGCLKKYSHEKIQTYYLINSKKFFSSMRVEALNVRMYHIADTSNDNVHFNFLESYADLGSDFLHEALEAHEEDLTRIGEEIHDLDGDEPIARDVNATPIESSTWTGRKVSLVDHGELSNMLNDVEGRLDQLSLPNSEKAVVRAYIIAARVLADSPDPPDEIIWELISRANQICGVASLFVSILALFSAAGH